MRLYSRFASLLVLLVLPLALQAQNWEPGSKARAKASRAASGLRKWKAHLQQWGLDSSYNRSLCAGARLNSDGWSGSLTYGRRSGQGSMSLWQLRFSEVKHEKETRQQGSNAQFTGLGSGTPYIFGKRNNLYLLQLGYSRGLELLPAVLDGNTGIGFRYGGGLTLAMLKPYYLQLIYPDYSVSPATAQVREEPYGDANAERFLNPSMVLGRGRWSEGLDRMRYVPGLYGECAVVITPGGRKAFVQTISLGAQGMLCSARLPLLAEHEGAWYQLRLFAGLDLGKRWKR